MSKASEDLPEPDRPVITTSLSRGIVEIDVLEIVLARAAHGDGAAVEQLFDGGRRAGSSGGFDGSPWRPLLNSTRIARRALARALERC